MGTSDLAGKACYQLLVFNFDCQIDIGHFLTFVTLVVGFLGALVATLRTRRERASRDAKNGALRFLLHLLRKRVQPVSLTELKTEFDSGANQKIRRAYTGRDFKFKDFTQFEAAIYGLDIEGKIDFTSSDEIVFRVDRYTVRQLEESGENSRILGLLSSLDKQKILQMFRSDFVNTEIDRLFDLVKVARLAWKVDPESTKAFLEEQMKGRNVDDERKAILLMLELQR